ncbi:MAG: outer membrane protein assembly factor BamA [Hyphomicrobiaceae bacterium]|nr:outer membrane protein assembly factor BamA [Hyphomicrobiaceae bacterium]
MAALLVILCLASGLFPPMNAAIAQDGRIRDIQVSGNRRVEPETVRSYLRFSVGDSYDAGKVDQSVRALFATGLFADVSIERSGAGVVVKVVENPVINQVAFEGNRDVEDGTLAGEVQLKPRSVYTRAKVQADVQRILDVYRRQGKFAASVEPKIIDLDQNRVNLVFEINEGGSTKVKSIQFIGNRAFSESQLRDVISTQQSGWFDFVKNASFYDPDRLALDRELLRQYYLKNGYADVRIVSANADLDRDGSGFYIAFVVEEGELYKFGDVRIESGLPGLNPSALQGELLTKPGATYNAADIDKTVERLTLLAAEQGFAFARVRPRADREASDRRISLVYAIDEGARIYIERINIIGNTRTRDHVIRREFRLAEGDAYNPLLVDRAKKRLQGLGFFKTVEIKRRPGSAQDRVLLDVELVEQPTGELSFGAGYSTSEGVIGDISLTERNLMGNGQFLRLRLSGSVERLQVDLSFTEPRFLDRNLAAGFDLFHKELSSANNSVYRSRRTGGSLRLGFPLSENLWAQTFYTISRDEIFDVDKDLSDGRIASRAIIQSEGVSYTSLVGTTLTYDKRNHPKNPNRGFYLSGGVDLAGVGGDVQYTRISAEGRYYYPITENITFVGRAIAGHIEGWGGDDVRLIDLYYKGGETLRGFNRGGYGPRDLATSDALGGKTFYAATAEVRYPLPFVPDDLGVKGAVFVDAGSLFGVTDWIKNNSNQCAVAAPAGQPPNICLVDSSAPRVSVGTSLIWDSPLGPLRADFGWAVMKEDYDKEQLFRFGASTKF